MWRGLKQVGGGIVWGVSAFFTRSVFSGGCEADTAERLCHVVIRLHNTEGDSVTFCDRNDFN